MRINNNIPALNAHRLLNQNNTKSSGILERLSSGKKINRAADDAAGMAISEKMKAQVRGLKKASQNTLDGISLIQTAEGAMNEVHAMLQRMRELAVQSANGTLSSADRKSIQDEINQLTSEINRIANGTEFNTRNILRGNTQSNSNAVVHRMSTGGPAVFTSTTSFGVKAQEVFTVVGDIADLNDKTLTINGVTIGFHNLGEAVPGAHLNINTSGLDATGVAGAIRALSDSIIGVNIIGTGASFIVQAESVGVQGNDIQVLSSAHAAFSMTAATINLTGGDDGDSQVVNLGPLSTGQQLSIWIDGQERSVNLDKLDGTPQNATKASLLEALNNAMGDLGKAVWTKDGTIEIRTTSIGGSSEVKITGTGPILSALFNDSNPNNLMVKGSAEKDTGNAVGTFYFDEVPEPGSTLTIGNGKIEFFDSRIGPYTGSNRPINLASGTTSKSVEDLVLELANLEFPGVTLSVDPNVSQRLVATANATGFSGQTVFLEGTPKEFITNLQIGPNQGQGFRLSIGDIRATRLGISSSSPQGNTGVQGSAFFNEYKVTDGLSEAAVECALDVSSEQTATAAITVYDRAITKVAQLRGALGAIQNRLEYTAANLDNTTENLTAALSRIEDADMALEMSEFTKFNILMQSGTAMLVQANQRPQSILQLLGN